jgi:hypothetical protein
MGSGCHKFLQVLFNAKLYGGNLHHAHPTPGCSAGADLQLPPPTRVEEGNLVSGRPCCARRYVCVCVKLSYNILLCISSTSP